MATSPPVQQRPPDPPSPSRPPGFVAALRQSGAAATRVMACGPHVHEASLARAVDAGCDEVATRGEFERRLNAALAELASRGV